MMENDLSSNHNTTTLKRQSLLLNEDDFDYAIELKPDDEYRQTAESLPQIVDFDEIDFEGVYEELALNRNEEDLSYSDRSKLIKQNSNSYANNYNNNNNRRTTNFDARMLDIYSNHHSSNPIKHGGLHYHDDDDNDIEHGSDKSNQLSNKSSLTQNNQDNLSSKENHRWSISKNEFSFRINLLEKHRKWTEKAARRSSIGFEKDHPYSNDKETMDKFLVALAGGIHIRRHQAHKMPEIVRLYSVTGCRTIEWEKPKINDLRAQQIRQGLLVDEAVDALHSSNKFDRSIFDCSIAICGCGDDLTTDHAPDRKEDQNISNHNAASDKAGFGKCFYNVGFKRDGVFRDLDVLAVHPAGREDPTSIGNYGTETLRHSKETYSQELTFSIIIRDFSTTQGYSTLDIECEELDCYYLLLRGFRLLQEESEKLRAKYRSYNSKSTTSDHHLVGSDDGSSLMNSEISEDLSNLWNMTRVYMTGAAHILRHPKSDFDPVNDLFAPNSGIDPLRAYMVGGGLVSVHSPIKTNTGKAVSSHTAEYMASPDTHLSSIENYKIPNKTNVIQPIAQFLGWNSAGTQIWARLKMAGLDVKCVISWDLKRVILKVRCPTWRLEQMAEQMHLKIKSRSGYLKQFKVVKRDTFLHIGANGSVFRSSERQQIIDYIIRSKIKDGGAELDESTELGSQIVQRFPLHMYSKLADIRHSWVTFWKRESYGKLPDHWSPFSVSYSDTYKEIKLSIHYFFSNLLTQPLDSIAEYFGENVAFYFAYMSFYTRWLVFPSLIGIIVFAVQMKSKHLDNWVCPVFAVFVVLWACFMLAFWRQKASALAFRWGVLDYEVEETERPQFRGAYTYDESTGEVRKTYSLWKRTAKYCLSTPVLILSVVVMLIIMTSAFYSQACMAADYENGRPIHYAPQFPSFSLGNIRHNTPSSTTNNTLVSLNSTTTTDPSSSSSSNQSNSYNEYLDANFWGVTFFYPCLYGMVVSLFTSVFQFLAISLNDFENHRTQTTYTNRLILKIFSFQFVTVFTSLYYYAFFTANVEQAFQRIAINIFSLMTVGQWWTMFLDIAIPAFYHRILLYSMKSGFAKTNKNIYIAKEYIEKLKTKELKKLGKKTNGNNNSSNGSQFSSKIMMLSDKLEKRISYFEQAKSKCWEEALQAKYNNFSDYTTMVIQIGFVLFFSSVFPLCPLLALLNNIALIRFNAMKICFTRQRPISQKIGGIGVWEDVIQMMSVGGILTTCALFGFTSTQIRDFVVPYVGFAGLVVLLFAYEHLMLFFKYWLHSSIPSIAPSVQRARTRERKSMDRKILSKKKDDYSHGGKKDKKSRNSSTGYWFDLSANPNSTSQHLNEIIDRSAIDSNLNIENVNKDGFVDNIHPFTNNSRNPAILNHNDCDECDEETHSLLPSPMVGPNTPGGLSLFGRISPVNFTEFKLPYPKNINQWPTSLRGNTPPNNIESIQKYSPRSLSPGRMKVAFMNDHNIFTDLNPGNYSPKPPNIPIIPSYNIQEDNNSSDPNHNNSSSEAEEDNLSELSEEDEQWVQLDLSPAKCKISSDDPKAAQSYENTKAASTNNNLWRMSIFSVDDTDANIIQEHHQKKLEEAAVVNKKEDEKQNNNNNNNNNNNDNKAKHFFRLSSTSKGINHTSADASISVNPFLHWLWPTSSTATPDHVAEIQEKLSKNIYSSVVAEKFKEKQNNFYSNPKPHKTILQNRNSNNNSNNNNYIKPRNNKLNNIAPLGNNLANTTIESGITGISKNSSISQSKNVTPMKVPNRSVVENITSPFSYVNKHNVNNNPTNEDFNNNLKHIENNENIQSTGNTYQSNHKHTMILYSNKSPFVEKKSPLTRFYGTDDIVKRNNSPPRSAFAGSRAREQQYHQNESEAIATSGPESKAVSVPLPPRLLSPTPLTQLNPYQYLLHQDDGTVQLLNVHNSKLSPSNSTSPTKDKLKKQFKSLKVNISSGNNNTTSHPISTSY